MVYEYLQERFEPSILRLNLHTLQDLRSSGEQASIKQYMHFVRFLKYISASEQPLPFTAEQVLSACLAQLLGLCFVVLSTFFAYRHHRQRHLLYAATFSFCSSSTTIVIITVQSLCLRSIASLSCARTVSEMSTQTISAKER